MEVMPPFHAVVYRAPLTVAWTPEEVPPWDWTRGFPLEVEVEVEGHPILGPHMRGERPYGPEVEEAFLELVGEPDRACLAEMFPRLVRRHAGPWSPPKVRDPLREVLDLGWVAQADGPTSPRFVRKAIQVAEKVGPLHPIAEDALHTWHALARVFYLTEGLLHTEERGATMENLASEALKPWWEYVRGNMDWVQLTRRGAASALSGTAEVLHLTAKRFARALREGPPGLRYTAWVLQSDAIRLLGGVVDRSRVDGEEPVEVYGGALPILLWEAGRLLASGREAKRCPWCHRPFVPYRKTQETCGRDACIKGVRRKRKEEAFSR